MNMFKEFINMATNRDEELLLARNAAQIELAEKKGVDFGAWLDMRYDDKFRELVEKDPTILKRLADKETHNETIEELETKIYH